MKNRNTIVLSEKELKEILGKHFKINPQAITYAGWTGILNMGEFRIEVQENQKEGEEENGKRN